MIQRQAEASAFQIDEAAWNGYGRRRPFGTLMSRGRAREIIQSSKNKHQNHVRRDHRHVSNLHNKKLMHPGNTASHCACSKGGLNLEGRARHHGQSGDICNARRKTAASI